MRCLECNFVSRTDFDVCPYCKHQIHERFFIHLRIRLKDYLEITVGSIVLIIGINLFVAILVVDLVTKFQFNISFFMLSLLALFSLITAILSKPLIVRSIWKIDAYVIFVCCVALLFFNEYGIVHVGFGDNDYFCAIIANYVLPCEFIVFVSLETLVLFIDKK